jgi:hypothetical protein
LSRPISASAIATRTFSWPPSRRQSSWSKSARPTRSAARAELLGGEHAVERVVARGRGAQQLGAVLGLAAAQRGAARPVLRRGAQLGIGRAERRALERLARLVAVAEAPGGEPIVQSPSATHGPLPAPTVAASPSACASRFSM